MSVIIVAAILMSGCTRTGAATDATGPITPSRTLVADNETADVGALTGRVVDDEERPVANARVSILRLDAQLATGEDGGFAFDNVPAGKHDVVVERLGYESLAKKVEVRVGETTEATFVLLAIRVEEPFHVSQAHVAIHHFGQADVDWAIHSTLGQNQTCETCTRYFYFDAPPRNVLLEMSGKHTVTYPLGPDAEWIYFYDGKSGGANIHTGNVNLPSHQVFDDDQVDKIKTFRLQMLCDFNWFCIEERRDAWFTAFFDMEAPEDFTARPE